MTKRFEYVPEGVCSKHFLFEIDDNNTILSLNVVGGCNGNLKGISSILKGMKVEDVISRFENITCRERKTSCPDQISKALKRFLELNK